MPGTDPVLLDVAGPRVAMGIYSSVAGMGGIGTRRTSSKWMT